MKKTNKKGFTLAELLVVVAIIAVLVAISIPIFTSQLEKSREATDLANIRVAYAECSSAVLTETASTTDVTIDSATGTASAEVILTQSKKGWTGDNGKDVAGKDITTTTATSESPKGTTVTISVTKDGEVTIADKAQ